MNELDDIRARLDETERRLGALEIQIDPCALAQRLCEWATAGDRWVRGTWLPVTKVRDALADWGVLHGSDLLDAWERLGFRRESKCHRVGGVVTRCYRFAPGILKEEKVHVEPRKPVAVGDERRRRLHLERVVVRAWLGGAPIEALAAEHAVPVAWVNEALRRYSRGTLRLEPGQ